MVLPVPLVSIYTGGIGPELNRWSQNERGKDSMSCPNQNNSCLWMCFANVKNFSYLVLHHNSRNPSSGFFSYCVVQSKIFMIFIIKNLL